MRHSFVANDETYGMPRIRAEMLEAGGGGKPQTHRPLDATGHMCGVSRRRSYVVTIQRDARQRPAPDLVNRAFVATEINQLWVADMTYIPTWSGFLYRSMVIDIFSHKVVGWAFGERMTADLVSLALNSPSELKEQNAKNHFSCITQKKDNCRCT